MEKVNFKNKIPMLPSQRNVREKVTSKMFHASLWEKENILRIFKESKKAIENSDSIQLKKLSNQTIHSASVNQDSESIAIAVIIYSLSKIIEREKYQKSAEGKKFYNLIISLIDNSITSIEKGDEKEFKLKLDLIRKAIDKLSGNLKKNIQEVFRKASINKASRIYEHGISMEQTAKLLGITMFELANYSGQTGISEVAENKTANVKSRIKTAENIFK